MEFPIWIDEESGEIASVKTGHILQLIILVPHYS